MPLHPTLKRARTQQKPIDDVYTTQGALQTLPKHQFPKSEANASSIYNLIHDELMLDGNARQNFATFCTTWSEPEVFKLMSECMDKNMIDKDEYPQTAEIENRCIHMLASLWHAPDEEHAIGCSTTGSSEAAMLGGMAMKWKWREKRKKEGKSTENPNLICGPVQICWHKFARYWDIELREVPMDPNGRLLLTPEEVIKRCDENTIGVVPTLGVTFTCEYEPVKAIADALDKLEKETGLDIPIHVDGASGAFIAPFCSPDLVWDFAIPRVKSINASGHKYGMAPLGVGWALWRTEADLPEDLIFRVNYLGGDMPTFALNFSRPGGEIICQYYNFCRLGSEGYAKIHNNCYATARYVAAELEKLNIFEIIYNGEGGMPAVCWKLKKNAKVAFNLYDLADRLRTRGWQVPAYALPANCEEVVIQRVLIKHGVSRDLAELLITDMNQAVAFFATHPQTVPLTAEEASSGNHGGHASNHKANRKRIAAGSAASHKKGKH